MHIAPSDARGKPLGKFLPAQSRIVQDTTLIPQVNELYRNKYGLVYRLMNLMNRFRYSKTGESVFLNHSLLVDPLSCKNSLQLRG